MARSPGHRSTRSAEPSTKRITSCPFSGTVRSDMHFPETRLDILLMSTDSSSVSTAECVGPSEGLRFPVQPPTLFAGPLQPIGWASRSRLTLTTGHDALRQEALPRSYLTPHHTPCAFLMSDHSPVWQT